MISPKAAIGIAAGVCGTVILGYCIYFDKQRHDDPDFKKKLRERKYCAGAWGMIVDLGLGYVPPSKGPRTPQS